MILIIKLHITFQGFFDPKKPKSSVKAKCWLKNKFQTQWKLIKRTPSES